MTEKTNYILRSIQESMMDQREKCEQIRSVFIMAER